MRFLFTVASYYPEIGGVQMVTKNTAEELVKQGHDVTVLVSKHKNTQVLSEYNGVKLEYWELYTEKDRIVGDVKAYCSFLKKRCETVDVLVSVSVHSALTDAILPYIREFNCKTVLYLHGIYEFRWSQKDKSSVSRILSKLYYNSRRRLFYSKLYRYARNFDVIVHLSADDASMTYMQKYGITQNIVIHNSAERAYFEPPQTVCTERYFLQVANYAEHKNQEFSLEAFYRADCPDVGLIYVGSQKNAYYEKLLQRNDQLAREYGSRKVEFRVGISRDETIELTKHALAIVLSSRVEKFPMVLIEGLACGVPFISTDCGCVNTLPGGMVVTDKNGMSAAMTEMENDKRQRDRLGKLGKEYAVENFSLRQNVEKLVQEIIRRQK